MARKSKSQKIKEAVMNLDQENDDHWTDNGKPAMKAVEDFYGSSSITRRDVEDVVGTGFLRGSIIEEDQVEEKEDEDECEEPKETLTEYEYAKSIRAAVSKVAMESKRVRRVRHGKKNSMKKGKKTRTYLNGG